METLSAQLACDCRCELAEGPVWHEGALYWVNILHGELHCLRDGDASFRSFGGLVGAAVPAGRGRWLLARDDGFVFVQGETGAAQPIHDPESHLPGNRFNDGKCDPQGRFWAGTMSLRGESHTGALYVIDAALEPRKVLENVSLSNGLDWSPDGRSFYHIDTPTRRVDVFAFDGAAGTISGRRTLYAVPDGQGYPDGMTVDETGNLWIALWGGSAVICINPATGREISRVSTPVSQPSSCTFGGENLDTLFITSAWQNLSAEQRSREPLAGGIFRVNPGVRGRPANAFGG